MGGHAWVSTRPQTRLTVRFSGHGSRLCQSCDVCQRTENKGSVPKVPMEKIPLIDNSLKPVAIDLMGPTSPPSEARHRYISDDG